MTNTVEGLAIAQADENASRVKVSLTAADTKVATSRSALLTAELEQKGAQAAMEAAKQLQHLARLSGTQPEPARGSENTGWG